MHKPSGLRDYFVACFIAFILTAFLSAYLLFRRGYFFDAPPTADMLFIPNKAIAGAGMTLLAFTFLIGPIVRYFDRFDSWLQYRKEIGIVGGFLAIFHGIVSYFFLPKKFPQEYLDFTTLEFGAGLIGAFLLLFLFILSFKSIIAKMEGSKWWFLQRWGLRFVIILTLLHVFVMKWPGWMKWLKQGGGNPTAELANPWLPGAGILVSMFIAWVVIVRLYEMIFLYKDFGIRTKEITVDPILRARGRGFFVWSFWILVVLYALIITKYIF